MRGEETPRTPRTPGTSANWILAPHFFASRVSQFALLGDPGVLGVPSPPERVELQINIIGGS